jgi:hypothetical protein
VPLEKFNTSVLFSVAPPTRLKYSKEHLTTPSSPFSTVMAVSMERFVLPGETLDAESLPSHPTLPLKLGPGVRHIPPNTITPTVAGQLCTDKRKNAVWVEFNGGRVYLLIVILEALADRYKVHSYSRRSHHSYHPPLLGRRLLRQSQRLCVQCHPSTTLVRRSHKENPPNAFTRCAGVCTSQHGEQTYGS